MRCAPLLSTLVLPVVARGFQVSKMPPNACTMSLDGPSSTGTRKRSSVAAPLRYTEDPNAVAIGSSLSKTSVPLKINGGSSTAAASATSISRGGAALTFATKAIPAAAVATALAVFVTNFLAQFSSPAAQGLKLVYAGAIAGILSRTACAPIEMVSTVMMCLGDESMSMTDELKKTWKKEGMKGMFKGNGANCLKVAPSRGTQFLVYEFVKKRMLLAGVGLVGAGSAAGSLHAGSRLFAGGVAGMVAAMIVYPLEVVKTMLTLYPDRCASISDALKMVYKQSGITGLYRGLGPTLIAMFPYVGVEFMVYETLKRRWEMYVGPVGTLALLLLGAAGGAAAQASAHPLDVIRRRMQMQSINADKKDDDNKVAQKRYSNMFAGLYQVGKKEGVHVLFKGLGPACLEKIPSTAIGYFIYEFLKTAMKVSSI